MFSGQERESYLNLEGIDSWKEMRWVKKLSLSEAAEEPKWKELYLLKDHRRLNGNLDSKPASQSEPESSVGLQRANSP